MPLCTPKITWSSALSEVYAKVNSPFKSPSFHPHMQCNDSLQFLIQMQLLGGFRNPTGIYLSFTPHFFPFDTISNVGKDSLFTTYLSHKLCGIPPKICTCICVLLLLSVDASLYLWTWNSRRSQRQATHQLARQSCSLTVTSAISQAGSQLKQKSRINYRTEIPAVSRQTPRMG